MKKTRKTPEQIIELLRQADVLLGKGQKVGDVIVELAGEEIVRRPLVALEDVAEGGLWRQAVDTVKLWME